ncbi:MAG: hypothetical protein K0S39_772 [Paenibacillus sp.]|jgi:hypothetical protein|nr:hypothetical protein [Paenibacillus sp.]
MNAEAIFFEFDNTASAKLAQGTLEELGYKTGLHSELSRPALHIEVDHSELVSALEIAQAHGGRLIEHGQGVSETDTYAIAYNNEDFISIPAHVINEDWPENYATTANAGPADGTAGESDSGNGAEVFDPSGDGYNHFDAGIRL